MSTTTAGRPGKLHSVQALRALAATSVVVDHAFDRPGSPSVIPEPLAWQFGLFGVWVFFVISGLIMVHTSSNLAEGWRGGAQFLERRIKRIAPLYWIATLYVVGVLVGRGIHVEPGTVLASFAFIAHNSPIAGERLKPLVGQGWTLVYEMFFYVIFAGALALPRRLSAAVAVAILIVLVTAGAFVKPLTDTAEAETLAAFYTDPIILLFGAGIAIGVARRYDLLPRLTNLPISLFTYLAALGLCVAVLLEIGLPSNSPLGVRTVFELLAVLCVVVAASERAIAAPGRVGRLAEHLGDASYSLYLFHSYTFSISSRVLLKLWPAAPGWLVVVVMVLVACAVASLIYRYIEVPITRELGRVSLFSSRPARTAPAVSGPNGAL